MRFAAPKTSFLEAISAVTGATQSGGDEVYAAIQIEANQTDQSISLRAVSPAMAISTTVSGAVEADGKVMVNGRILASLSRVAQGHDIDVELIANELHFSGKSGGISCNTLAEGDFPYPTKAAPPVFCAVDGQEFKRAVAMCSSVSLKEPGHIYGSLRLMAAEGSLSLTGCDNNRMVKVTIAEHADDFVGNLPLRAAQVAAKLAAKTDTLVLSGDNGRIGFTSGQTVMRAVQQAGTWPDIERIIPEKAGTLVTVSLPELLGAVSRIKAVAKSGANDFVKIFLTTEEEAVTISCKGMLGSVNERIAAEVEGPLVVNLALKWQYFVDACEFMEPEYPATLGFVTEKKNMFFVNHRNWQYMAVPILKPGV